MEDGKLKITSHMDHDKKEVVDIYDTVSILDSTILLNLDNLDTS